MVQEVKEVSPPGQAYRCFRRQRQWCGDVVQGTLRSTFGKPRETGRRKATELRRLGGKPAWDAMSAGPQEYRKLRETGGRKANWGLSLAQKRTRKRGIFEGFLRSFECMMCKELRGGFCKNFREIFVNNLREFFDRVFRRISGNDAGYASPAAGYFASVFKQRKENDHE